MSERAPIDWEAFYANYRKPGYVPGYEILHKIGAGAFGMVFKARKESIEKHYAIKFLKVDDEAVRDAIVRELDAVRLFAQLDHPNLVSIEDKGDVCGIPYIVMNYAGDATVRTRLDDGAIERDEALRIFLQVARGIRALHEHSLVHFDLKPGNIFLKGDHARVGDYGLSRLMTQSRNSLSMGRGTPFYMAPEMLRSKGSQHSDIYSLGVLLYEILTGTVPFQGDSEWEVLRKHETEEPEFPKSIGEPERSVISRCLQKRPEDRFESAADLIAALAGTTPEVATPTATPPRPMPTPPPPPRQRTRPPIPAATSARRTRPRRPLGRNRRRGSRFALGIAIALFCVVGLPLSLVVSSSQVAHSNSTDITRPQDVALPAHQPAPDPADLVALEYAADTPFSERRYVEDHIATLMSDQSTQWSEQDDYVAGKLATHKAPTLVCAVNHMSRLNYSLAGDVRKAHRLNKLLVRLTGEQNQITLGNTPKPHEIEHNHQTVAAWWVYCNDQGSGR